IPAVYLARSSFHHDGPMPADRSDGGIDIETFAGDIAIGDPGVNGNAFDNVQADSATIHGGQSTGKIKFNEFTIKKTCDVASPAFFQATLGAVHRDHGGTGISVTGAAGVDIEHVTVDHPISVTVLDALDLQNISN